MINFNSYIIGSDGTFNEYLASTITDCLPFFVSICDKDEIRHNIQLYRSGLVCSESHLLEGFTNNEIGPAFKSWSTEGLLITEYYRNMKKSSELIFTVLGGKRYENKK